VPVRKRRPRRDHRGSVTGAAAGNAVIEAAADNAVAEAPVNAAVRGVNAAGGDVNAADQNAAGEA